MTLLTRAAFAGASLLLMIASLALVVLGFADVLASLRQSEGGGADAVLDGLGYLIVAIAVFDVAKYLFEEEVRRGKEKRSAAEARRSLTKFLSTVVIALFLEGLVVVFKTARTDVALLVYPTMLLLASAVILVGLGAFQRFSAAVEERVGDDDDAEERKEGAS